MPDQESLKLDRKILEFIRRFPDCSSDNASFQDLALKIFSFQFRRNDNYRKFCLIEGKTPANVKNWRQIPAIPTAGFKELVLTTSPVQKTVKIFKTSGTTGASRGAHFFDTLKLYNAAIAPPFRQYLLPDTHNFLFCYLISSPKDSPNSSLSYMIGVIDKVFAKGKGRYFVKGSEIDHDLLIKNLKAFGKKVFILSTAFSLKSFLDFLKKKDIALQLPKGSRLMETGGFKGRVKEVSKKALYTECRKRLGIDPAYCVSEYGMTELSSQFYDTSLRDECMGIRRKPFKAGPAWLRTLVIDPKTGKAAKKGSVGLLRHFDLANRGSVLAVQTEDMGRETGEGFELLGRAKGSQLRGCSLSYEEFLKS